MSVPWISTMFSPSIAGARIRPIASPLRTRPAKRLARIAIRRFVSPDIGDRAAVGRPSGYRASRSLSWLAASSCLIEL